MTSLVTRDINYFAEKYQLTVPHSELVAALPMTAPGNALDLGCGNGRNTLYLQQQGFTVTAWDKNPASLQKLASIVAIEQLDNIKIEQHDFDQLRFNGAYQFIVSTVVMMFLRPATIPQMIADMQASTIRDGYNLIVAAMDTPDYPCNQGFSFTFRSGELSEYYRNWHIIKYNENIGELHRKDANGKRISLRFATLLAQKSSVKL